MRVATAQEARQRPLADAEIPGGEFSFDHFSGQTGERQRDREPERLRGLEVDDDLVFVGALDGQVAGFRAFEYAIDVTRSLPELFNVVDVDAVGHQPTPLRKVGVEADRRQAKP